MIITKVDNGFIVLSGGIRYIVIDSVIGGWFVSCVPLSFPPFYFRTFDEVLDYIYNVSR